MLKTARHQEHVGKRTGRLADIGSANLWLAEGAPAADVLTMLETRHRFELSSADCRAYAIDILWAAQQQIPTTKPSLNLTPKEPHHAVA